MNRTLDFVVKTGEVSNTYNIKFPNVEQLIQFEELKVSLCRNYKEIYAKNSILGDMALDAVDMIAYLQVLCPDLLKDLKTPLLQMDLIDFNLFRHQWNDQFTPWWNHWIKLLKEAPKVTTQPVEDTSSQDEKEDFEGDDGVVSLH